MSGQKPTTSKRDCAPGFAGSFGPAGLGPPNNVEVVPLPNGKVVVAVPLVVDEVGFAVFPKMLPPLPSGVGVGVTGFAPNRVLPADGLVEVVPPPNKLVVAGVVVVVVPGAGVVEVAPKSEVPGVEPKMLPGAVVVVPVVFVPGPVVPMLVAGAPNGLGVVPPPPLTPSINVSDNLTK